LRETTEKTARSVDEFIKIVSEVGENLWFRGQANAEWALVPRLYRDLAPQSNVREEDDDTREEFIRQGASLSDIRPADKWDWYFVMQHHGAPTRLLDWTDGSLIGLFFAVRENEGFHDASVWILDPWKLNKSTVGKSEVLPPGDPGNTRADNKRYNRWLPDRFAQGPRWPAYPAAVYPRHSTRRIAAQQSCFTIHGSDRHGLEQMSMIRLVKIVIPSWSVGAVQDCLQTCGINETTVFPDLDGLGRYLGEDDHKAADRSFPHDQVFTRLRPSRIAKGQVGVVAIRKIKKNTNLFLGDNEEMVWEEEGDLPRRPKSIRELYGDFAVRRTDPHDKKKRYGCPTSFNRLTVAWYVNKSKAPNVRCDPRYYSFTALRDIEPGEELSADYSKYSE